MPEPASAPSTERTVELGTERAAVLRTRGLTRSFGKMTAVAGIDLEVLRGEVYGFLGRNGAGKTTTLRMLMGILKPDQGLIELLGNVSSRIGPKQKREIGYVSQEQFFYPWMTARELGRFISGFYPRWDAAEFTRLLKLLDIPDQRRASELSGGTRTKLGLALALAHHPELLLLDEPTTGLDPVARREFLEMLLHEVRHRGQTVFFSSHLVGEVELVADRIGILQRGVLRYQGALTELRASVRRVVLPDAPGPMRAALEPVGDGVPERSAGASETAMAAAAEASAAVEPSSASAPSMVPQASLSAPVPVPGEGSAFPPGYVLIREDRVAGVRSAVVRADPDRWARADAPFGPGETLSLEDIFLAYARETALPG